MAPPKYRFTGPKTRNSRVISGREARSISTRPQALLRQWHGASQKGNQNEVELTLDFDDESFIQSIEELLPEQEQSVDRCSTPPPSRPSALLQVSPITPGKPIKVERVSDSIDDIYDVSPRGYVYKAADAGRRQTSRSTAQLTTPGSSPESKGEVRNAATVTMIVKSESLHENDRRHRVSETSCTPPASSPERYKFQKRPASTNLQSTWQAIPSRESRIHTNDENSRETSIRAEGNLPAAILSTRPILVKQSRHQSTAVPGHAFSAKISEAQKNCKKMVEHGSLGEKSIIEHPPILLSSKVRPSSAKTMTNPSSEETPPMAPSIPKEQPSPRENAPNDMGFCMPMFSKCNSRDMPSISDTGTLGQRQGLSRLKSVSACSSSVSSFDPGDNIPPLHKMHQEFGRVITESARKFALAHMLEMSPSLRYDDLLARLGIHHETPKDERETSIYEDFDGESLPEKNSSRVIFNEAGKNAVHNGPGDDNMSSCSTGDDDGNAIKRLQRIPRRSLRSLSVAQDRSRTAKNLSHEGDLGAEEGLQNEPFLDSVAQNNDDVQGEDSGSEYEELTSRKASAQSLLKNRNNGQGVKRVREVVYDWPTFSDGEDTDAEDDIIEIDRDIFAMSENRRKKRHKSSSKEAKNDSVSSVPIPKKEPLEDVEGINLNLQDCRPARNSRKDSLENVEREKIPCSYYMNTYWDHGRASDGRRTRDGFTSYVDFKEYCRKNKQPTDDGCILTYKKDLKHYLLCEHHATLRRDLFRAAWNFEHNPGFSFKSCSKDEETRRLQNEAIGNAQSPGGSLRGPAPVADGQVAEIIAEVLKVIGSSHAADVAQLTKSKKKLETEVKGLKTRLARIQKR